MTLKEMLNHEFMTMNKIPDMMPISTLVCPPSSTFVRQFIINPEESKILIT